MAKRIPDEDCREAVRLVGEHGGNIRAAARASGILFDNLYKRYRRGIEELGLVPAATSRVDAPTEKEKWQESGEAASFEATVSKPVRTLKQLIEICGCDQATWYVETWSCTAWTTAMKLKQPSPDGGKEKYHKPHLEQNYRVTAKFKRKFPRRLEQAIDGLVERIAKHAPSFSLPKRKAHREPHMLEFAPYDVHFGKLAWSQETGSDYDLNIASKVFRDAFEEILLDTSHVGLEQIVIPLGQDFFHFDSLIGMAVPTTMNGTPQDVDGRWAKVFQVGTEAFIWGIEKCLSRAPVKVLWVPGNHDWFNSYHLCREVAAYFRLCKQVEVDHAPTSRKYLSYGVNLIGLAHGDQEKHHDLPNIMAGEVPELWAGAKVREWHLGHYHKKKETRYNEGDSFGSVKVRILPSLSGTDGWHYRKGYVNSPRACEAYLWSKSRGLHAYFNSPVLN